MAGKLKQLKSICRIGFNKRDKYFRRNKTNLAIFNHFCGSTGKLIAKNTAVSNNISFFCKSDYLFFAVKTCFKNFYNATVNTKEATYPVSFLIKNIPTFILPEIFFKV